MRKNNLDEMQEQKLLKIEHNGMWFAFWGLLASILIQICMGANFKQIAGEWVIFILLCLYTTIGCLKSGIWDRHLKPNVKTNVLVSIIAAFAVCVVYGFIISRRFYSLIGLLIGLAIYGIGTFAVCFIALEVSSKVYIKKREKLDKETETHNNEK